MRDFICPTCGQRLAFENSLCLSCRSGLGYLPERGAIVTITDGPATHRGTVSTADYRLCENLHLAECNWLVHKGSPTALCLSCALTRVRPNDAADDSTLTAFAEAEKAKRRLIAELLALELPLTGRVEDPDFGLAFDLKASDSEQVMTGHHNGVITLDLSEGDDVHREQLRIAMSEPYRTLLGHFRHEIGHYYFYRLITSAALRTRFEELFGDPDTDYQEALDRHYSAGAPDGWQQTYVSSYATMHPAEDWAETFAHYLHMRDTLDTAASFGFAPAAATFGRHLYGPSSFTTLTDLWLPLSWSLNMVNRSMGHGDLYPFVLAQPVLDKMHFVHEVVLGETSRAAQSAETES